MQKYIKKTSLRIKYSVGGLIRLWIVFYQLSFGTRAYVVSNVFLKDVAPGSYHWLVTDKIIVVFVDYTSMIPLRESQLDIVIISQVQKPIDLKHHRVQGHRGQFKQVHIVEVLDFLYTHKMQLAFRLKVALSSIECLLRLGAFCKDRLLELFSKTYENGISRTLQLILAIKHMYVLCFAVFQKASHLVVRIQE